ncbi:MAG TPA: hypothetical protein VGR45_02230, partial [Stellaceae bacterium]|nr:hypothetical protein [Stellaceae bacterium]
DLVVARLVERSAGADLAATKLLFELLRKIDPRRVATPSAPIGLPPADDPIAQVRAKLYRLAEARGLLPSSDAPPAVGTPPATPDPIETDPADPAPIDPAGNTADDDPIAQLRAKLHRLANARGLVSPSDAPSADSDHDDGAQATEQGDGSEL